MQVVTNNKGSGDWVRVIDDENNILFEGHSISPRNFVDLINGFGGVGRYKEEAELVEVTDAEMDDGDY